MSILGVLSKSLLETFSSRRFLPFFLLYFLFSLCFLILFMPILSVLPYLITLRFTSTHLALVGVNTLALLIVFIIVVLLNLWFTGALVYDVWTKKGFDAGLKYSQKLYWHLFVLCLIILLIMFFSSFLDVFGWIVQILVGWFFMFSLPSIVIRKDNFESAMLRSYGIVKNNLLRTFAFSLLVHFIFSLILFFSAFLVILLFSPLIPKLFYILQVFSTSRLEPFSQSVFVQAVGLLMNNYLLFILIGIIASLFSAFSYVFMYTAQTYYFLELSKKKFIPS